MREEENRSTELERLWEAYRWATPEPEASTNFQPELWARIEAERPVSWVGPLEWLAARLVPLAAAVTLAMAVLVWSGNGLLSSYVDVLAADLLEDQRPALFLGSGEAI